MMIDSAEICAFSSACVVKTKVRVKLQPRTAVQPRFQKNEGNGASGLMAHQTQALRLQTAAAQRTDQLRETLRLMDNEKRPPLLSSHAAQAQRSSSVQKSSVRAAASAGESETPPLPAG